jgi:hypothetical protein
VTSQIFQVLLHIDLALAAEVTDPKPGEFKMFSLNEGEERS